MTYEEELEKQIEQGSARIIESILGSDVIAGTEHEGTAMMIRAVRVLCSRYATNLAEAGASDEDVRGLVDKLRLIETEATQLATKD